MKSGRTTLDLKESELLDEVHKTEKEIDIYLKDRARQAEAILDDAQAKAETEQKRIDREVEGQFEEKVQLLVEEAKRKAETILEEGASLAESEQGGLEGRRDKVVEKILELVLEKIP
ncbi:MAG: hypothetical protein P1S46_03055 [bacterium]|nr:hypothetical protein [bacterium]MDT8396643.1 hypothetical protein [bacterium]